MSSFLEDYLSTNLVQCTKCTKWNYRKTLVVSLESSDTQSSTPSSLPGSEEIEKEKKHLIEVVIPAKEAEIKLLKLVSHVQKSLAEKQEM